MGIQITPSILNADFARLANEVARIPGAEAFRDPAESGCPLARG